MLTFINSLRVQGFNICNVVKETSKYGTLKKHIVANLYLTRVIPSEYLKVYLLSLGALVNNSAV